MDVAEIGKSVDSPARRLLTLAPISDLVAPFLIVRIQVVREGAVQTVLQQVGLKDRCLQHLLSTNLDSEVTVITRLGG